MDSTNQPPPSAQAQATSSAILRTYIAENAERLLGAISSYVQRWGVAGRQSAREIASEILGEMTEHALANPQRFDSTKQPGAWLLGIANNLILQRRNLIGRLHNREPAASTLALPGRDESDVDIFDRLAERARQRAGVDQTPSILTDLLAQATTEDRDLLDRIDLQGWNYAALAQQMGVSETTLRKRHFRAIMRLRQLATYKGGQQS